MIFFFIWRERRFSRNLVALIIFLFTITDCFRDWWLFDLFDRDLDLPSQVTQACRFFGLLLLLEYQGFQLLLPLCQFQNCHLNLGILYFKILDACLRFHLFWLK